MSKKTLHVTTATRQDVSEITQRHKAEGVSWKTARQRAWAWIRGMSGIKPWPAPKSDKEDGFVPKKAKATPEREGSRRGLGRTTAGIWWQVTFAALLRKRMAARALLKSAEIQVEGKTE